MIAASLKECQGNRPACPIMRLSLKLLIGLTINSIKDTCDDILIARNDSMETNLEDHTTIALKYFAPPPLFSKVDLAAHNLSIDFGRLAITVADCGGANVRRCSLHRIAETSGD